LVAGDVGIRVRESRRTALSAMSVLAKVFMVTSPSLVEMSEETETITRLRRGARWGHPTKSGAILRMKEKPI
jgi:hypothetical protein